MGFKIADCRLQIADFRLGRPQSHRCLSAAEGDDKPLTSGAKARWILERLRGPKGPLFHGAGPVARCWTTRRFYGLSV